MYCGPYNFSTVSHNIEVLVKHLNKGKYAAYGFEILTATQIEDTRTATLTHVTQNGQSDVHDYKAIGTSGTYGYPFLRPLYLNRSYPTMDKFAKIIYFIIRLIEKLDLDERVGGDPQVWFIPHVSELYRDKNRPELMESFEGYSNKAIEAFKKLISD